MIRGFPWFLKGLRGLDAQGFSSPRLHAAWGNGLFLFQARKWLYCLGDISISFGICSYPSYGDCTASQSRILILKELIYPCRSIPWPSPTTDRVTRRTSFSVQLLIRLMDKIMRCVGNAGFSSSGWEWNGLLRMMVRAFSSSAPRFSKGYRWEALI